MKGRKMANREEQKKSENKNKMVKNYGCLRHWYKKHKRHKVDENDGFR